MASTSAYRSSSFARPPGIPSNAHQYQSPDGSTKWKGPRRVCIFCSMAVIFPSLLIAVPLLMRFVIYGSNSYILHPSDVMLLDQRISTTWCQGAVVKLNTSFTAYVTNGEPTVFEKPTRLAIEQHMKIPDDQKEYWGLYLLPGSTFTIKTCAKYRGGTLLIVRGNDHMQYCAYVGENDSTGNSDEVSSSISTENMGKKSELGGATGKETGKAGENQSIISRLKTYLQSHPDSRDQIQKTLSNWMHENSTSGTPGDGRNETAFETTTTPPEASVEHGTIRRRRGGVDVRRNTSASGENGAFEDDLMGSSSEVSELIPARNRSVLDLKPFQTSQSIWKERHSQHSGIFNESVNLEDGSDSESESSFSSSEEALAKCVGVITTFKIPHDINCKDEGPFDRLSLTKPNSGLNTSYYEFHVEERDYYYFIFGSENEKQTNSIRAKFELDKVEYQLPEPVLNCTDVQECQIPLGFASSEKVVIRLPQPPPNASTGIAYVAETECRPRAYLYLIFVILVPIVILLFAFK